MASEEPSVDRQADAESRFVAILKFDLVNSTGISNALSPADELVLYRDHYCPAVERLVDKNQVKVKWEGDGGTFVFGYPSASPDAARNALLTALRMLETVGSVSAIPRLRLDVRVGIACGRVTIDKTTDALYRVEPFSRATRLMDHAEPGQILIADDTRGLVGHFFAYDDLGIVTLRGFGLMQVWRVTGATNIESRWTARRMRESNADIVGREDVLTQLSDAWSAAQAGRGSAVCLVGDSGIGKSRLARTVLDRARSADAVALEIDCTPSTGNSPLLPIGVLLRRLAGIDASTSETEKIAAASSLLKELLGDQQAEENIASLGPLFGIRSEPIPADKTREQLRARMIATTVAIFRAQATRKPLALLCEDLHWADDTTAQVVQNVAEIAPGIPLLLIATRWPKPVTPIDLESVTAAFTSVPVEPLAPGNAAQLVRALAGDGLSAARVDDIVSRCGGVPLLLEEVARMAAEQADPGAARRTAQPPDRAVPPELQLVVESRLDQLSDLRGIIEAASVLGRDFPVPALSAMVSNQDAVPQAIARFADHGLFRLPSAEHPDRAGFRHALLRDAVYETLVSRDYLRRLHSRAADTLASAYAGTPDASPEVLAQHLHAAHRLDEALTMRLAAGEGTFERGAYVEAGEHCKVARTLIEEIDDAARVRKDAFQLCVLLGKVESGMHGFSAESAESAYRDAERMFDDSTGPELQYPVIRGLALSSLVRGELAAAHQYSIEAFELARRSGRPDHRIDAMSVMAYTTLYFGRLADCRSWIEQCLALYEAERGERFRYPVPQDAKTAALALLPTAAWLLGDPEGAEAAIARGLEHVEKLGREFDKALLHAWISGVRYTQRRYGQALEHAGMAYMLSKEHKFQEWEGLGALMAAMSQSAAAPSAEGVGGARFIINALRANRVGLNQSYFLWGVARGHVTMGNMAEARQALDEALAAASGSQETRMNPELWLLQAEIEGDRPQALTLIWDAYHLADTQGAVANALRAAATILQRTGSDSVVEWAGTTLALLDGRDPMPAGPWMEKRLEHARGLLMALHPDAQHA